MTNFIPHLSLAYVRIAFSVLFFGIAFFGSSVISAQDDPTFKELIESVDSELNKVKSDIQSISTKDLHDAYKNEIKRLESEIERLESDDKFKNLEDEVVACKEKKESELKACKDDMAAQLKACKDDMASQLKVCNDAKVVLSDKHQGAEVEFQTEVSNLNVRISTLNARVNSLTAEIQEGQEKFISIHYNIPLVYTLDYLKKESNVNSITSELDFYSKMIMPAGIIRDSPEIVKSDVEVIKAVIVALNKKDIYYDKEVSIMHINKLQKVTSKTVKNVADELITLLQDNNCFNIRKELEKKINWKRSDKEDLPKFFELLLINYLYRNTIDIKDLHHNSWLVSQYDLLLETGKCGLDLQ